MSFALLFRVDLRRLIVTLAILSGLITLSISFYASYQVQRESLIDSTLEANRAYAAKLAVGTETFFDSVQQQLRYSADILAEQFDDETLRREVERLQLQTNSFNTVVVTDVRSVVRAISPNSEPLIGYQLGSPGAQEALRERRPLISSPYISALGTLVISISQPILDDDGTYLGYIGGVISLKEPNILNSMLGAFLPGRFLPVRDRPESAVALPPGPQTPRHCRRGKCGHRPGCQRRVG